MQRMDCYYINRGTCAIIPIDKDVSEVIELDCTYTVNKSSKDIIDESCKYYGCSYHGRLEGTKRVLNMNYKLPIMVEDYNNLIFFPTSSPRFGECIWISLNNIKNYEKINSCSKLIFTSDVELRLEMSYYSLENQIFRATMLDSMLRKRRNS
ncbi:MAG: competence protein ComK [Bacilli bacterium]